MCHHQQIRESGSWPACGFAEQEHAGLAEGGGAIDGADFSRRSSRPSSPALKGMDFIVPSDGPVSWLAVGRRLRTVSSALFMSIPYFAGTCGFRRNARH